MSGPDRTVIVGAGLAGITLARTLREFGSEGSITIIGDEAGVPYDRPPLSKDVLVTGIESGAMALCSDEDLANLRIARKVVAVTAVDPGSHTVTTSTGETIAFETLVLATGGSARTIAGLEPDGARVFELRTRDDALALARAMRNASSILIAGAGWIGLEVASSARGLGLSVTIVDPAPWPCMRVLPREVGEWLANLHRDAGTDLRLGQSCQFERTANGVRLASGEPFDLALSAVGMNARDALARAAGLACNNGILTDHGMRTSAPDIFAIGDVARPYCRFLAAPSSRQSWKAAIADAVACASSILHLPAPPVEAPWFWSEQLGRMVQAAGMLMAGDRLMERDGEDSPMWCFGDGKTVHFAVGVDRNRDMRSLNRDLTRHWQDSISASELVA